MSWQISSPWKPLGPGGWYREHRCAHAGHVHAQRVAVAHHGFGIGHGGPELTEAVGIEEELVHELDAGLIHQIGLEAEVAVVEQVVRLAKDDVAQVAALGEAWPGSPRSKRGIDAYQVGRAFQFLVGQVLRVGMRPDHHPIMMGTMFMRISSASVSATACWVSGALAPGWISPRSTTWVAVGQVQLVELFAHRPVPERTPRAGHVRDHRAHRKWRSAHPPRGEGLVHGMENSTVTHGIGQPFGPRSSEAHEGLK
jgi:hypothetical protein